MVEIPTPRWTAYDAKFFDVEMPEGTAMKLQDRASPRTTKLYDRRAQSPSLDEVERIIL